METSGNAGGARPSLPGFLTMTRRSHIPRFGLRAHFFVIGMLSALPFLATTVYTMFELRSRARDDLVNDVNHAVAFLSQMNADLLAASENYLAVEEAMTFRDADDTDEGSLRQLLSQRHEYVGCGFVRSDGTHVAVGDANPKLIELVRSATLSIGAERPVRLLVHRPTSEPARGARVIPVSRIVPSTTDGEAAGVTFVLIGLGEIRRDWDLLLKSFPDGSAYVGFDPGGTISIGSPLGANEEFSSATDQFGRVPRAGETITARARDGTERVWHFAVLDPPGLFGRGFLAGVGVPTKTVDSSVYHVLNRNLLGLLLTLIVLVLSGMWMIELRALRPLRTALGAIVALGEGNYQTRTNVTTTGGSIGKLLDSVDRTAEQLERHENERQRLFGSLAESEARYRDILDASSDGILLLDDRLQILTANRAFGAMVGVSAAEELEGAPLSRFVDPSHLARLSVSDLPSDPAEASAITVEIELTRSKDERVPAEVSFARTTNVRDGGERFVLVARDIRARQRLEEEKSKLNEQLLQSQKMESIGQLAGGVAHDFNNLLTVIHGYVSFGREYAESKEHVLENLDEIEKAAKRAGELTRQLLLFSRHQPTTSSAVDLDRVVDGLERMLKRLLGEQIVLRTERANDPWLISGDRGSIEQAIINLVVNARDAMPDGGTLTIRVENRTIDEEYLRKRPSARTGSFVAVTIRDTGTGISEEARPHVFEPFYTTKGRGKGTGLGLSVVFGVVEQLGGWIELESVQDVGTAFVLFFPVAPDLGGFLGPRVPALPILHGNGERILVVEDDDLIRQLVCQSLSDHGYDAQPARNKREAAEIISAQAPGEFELLFCDAMLPDGTGLDVCRIALASNPEIKVVYCSGYTDDNRHVMTLRDLGFPFLDKPFTVERLLRMVRGTLEGAGEP